MKENKVKVKVGGKSGAVLDDVGFVQDNAIPGQLRITSETNKEIK